MKFNDYPELINSKKEYVKIDLAVTDNDEIPKKSNDKEVLLAYSDATETGLEHIVKTNLANLIHPIIANLIYPVGSVIMTTDPNFDPATQFGGTWEQWRDGYLKADTTPNTNANTKGATDYKITKDMLPSHTHNMNHTHIYNPSNDPYFIAPGTDIEDTRVIKGASGTWTNVPGVQLGTDTSYGNNYSVMMTSRNNKTQNQKVSILFDHVHNYNGDTGYGAFANSAYKPGYYAVIAWRRTA